MRKRTVEEGEIFDLMQCAICIWYILSNKRNRKGVHGALMAHDYPQRFLCHSIGCR